MYAQAAEDYLRDVLQAAAQKYINKDAAGPDLLAMVQAGKGVSLHLDRARALHSPNLPKSFA